MTVPVSPHARLFYRCAFQRLYEARILQDRAEQSTIGAVYLAGYGVECILKALILNALPMVKQSEILRLFRGDRAHDFGWLRSLYLQQGGARFPPAVVRAFDLVSEWTTEIRYVPKHLKPAESERFIKAAGEIFYWADGRL